MIPHVLFQSWGAWTWGRRNQTVEDHPRLIDISIRPRVLITSILLLVNDMAWDVPTLVASRQILSRPNPSHQDPPLRNSTQSKTLRSSSAQSEPRTESWGLNGGMCHDVSVCHSRNSACNDARSPPSNSSPARASALRYNYRNKLPHR